MDPDEALAQIRAILDKPGPDAYADLATLVDALDEWLSTSGFLPIAWRHDGRR